MSDLLSKEERAAIADLQGAVVGSERNARNVNTLLDALDRLAPAPKPPEPLPHELPARWREESKHSWQLKCADELEAALKRERERKRSLIERRRGPISLIINRHIPCGPTAAALTADEIVNALLEELEP